MRKYAWMAAVLAGTMALTGCAGKKSTDNSKEAAVETEADSKTGSADEEAVSEAVSEAASEAVSEAAQESMSEEAGEAAEDAIADEITERPDYTALDYVTLGTYEGLTVTVDDIEVTEDEIDERMEDNIRYGGFLDTVTEGTVQDGDIANIDYVGKKDDEAFDGGTAAGYDLTIGSGTFIPGFEDGLVDVMIGETVDLDLTFPEEYQNEELAGEDVVFTVTVNSVQRMPEITDELAGRVSEGAAATVDEYREIVREELTDEAKQLQEDTIANELMTQLYNTSSVDEYPEDLVNYSAQEMYAYYEAYAQSMGIEFADFLSQYLGMDEDTFDAQVRLTIESSLEQELLLMAVAEKEGLKDISDEDFEAGCAKYAEQLGYESAEAFREAYDETRIRTSLAMDAAIDYIRDKAIVVTASQVEALSEAATESK